MNIADRFKDSWNLTLKQPVAFIVGGLITLVLGAVTFGILAGPLGVGLTMMYVRAKSGATVEAGDVMKYVPRTWPILLAVVLTGLIVMVGYCLLVIPGLVLTAWWLHVPVLVGDREQRLGEAMAHSRAIAARHGLLSTLVMLLCLVIMNGLGTAVAGVGILLTLPLSVGVIASCYVDGTA